MKPFVSVPISVELTIQIDPTDCPALYPSQVRVAKGRVVENVQKVLQRTRTGGVDAHYSALIADALVHGVLMVSKFRMSVGGGPPLPYDVHIEDNEIAVIESVTVHVEEDKK